MLTLLISKPTVLFPEICVHIVIKATRDSNLSRVATWAPLRSEVGRDDNIEGGIENLRAQKIPPKERRNYPDSKDIENQRDH